MPDETERSTRPAQALGLHVDPALTRVDLGWLTDAAWAYISDSVWEPLTPATGQEPTTRPETAAAALVELLNALGRRQHEHRERTAQRLAAVTGTGLLPADLEEMGTYYWAKAQRDLGNREASRQGMQRVTDAGGRLAPAARRGLAHLARLAGDFPAALATAESLGWPGRHHRVTGDVWWVQGDMARAAAAYEAARAEAETHGIAGERATSQAQRAFVLAFTHPAHADDEIDLATQLLTGLDLRATALTVQIASLVRDAGSPHGMEARIHALGAEINAAGLVSAQVSLELATCFHHAVIGADTDVAATIFQLRTTTHDGDYAYLVDIAHFMGGLTLEHPSPARWLDGEHSTRLRWRALVAARRVQ
ncbi:hypothetical protein OG524_36730 (plasmid) [Streptomyces sp. NBC_01520]|uniref:hypothetical protein n=1 Tax=Streptomyces sp. NBC_01520 TaxID=2903892 RepID=UPI00386C1FC5